jgi:hypothetical protein
VSDKAGQADDGEVALSAGVTGHGIEARLSSRGSLGAFLGLGLGVFVEFTLLDPLHDARHFMLTVLTVFCAGAAVTTAVCLGRIRDALRDKEYYRTEVNRMAGVKTGLEKTVVKKRLSSENTNPGPTGRGGKET